MDDRSGFLERVVSLIAESGVRYCVIGGVAINAYAPPIVTEDLDVVVAVDDLPAIRALLETHFRVRSFPHSLNVYDPGSRLQLQLHSDPALAAFVQRAAMREVMGLDLPVASPGDLLSAKIAAARDVQRRPSKRQKDLADILRLIEAFPDLRGSVPADLEARLFLE